MTEVEQREPPPKNTRRTSPTNTYWGVVLAPLTLPARRGKWFFVRRYATNGSANTAAFEIRKKVKLGMPDGKWDATARSGELFVRYLGDED